MVSDDKCALREALRDRRKQLSSDVVDAAGAAVHALVRMLPMWHAAAALVAYLPTENEIPTDGLIADWVRNHQEVYLPKSGAPPQFVRWRPGDSLMRGPGGVSEPTDGRPLPDHFAAVALIPVVGWADNGTRLGRGGGFYDRVLSDGSGGIVRVGLAYQFQRCEQLPHDPWDVSLDYVITEQRVVRCGDGVVLRPQSLQKGGLRIC
jgi:5-formyltetrahydrofolate cyclo-ligase